MGKFLIERIRSNVFIIVEIGCNFEGDMDRATEMIRHAAAAGVDAVKFQTFIPEKLCAKSAEKFWEIDGCPGKTQLEEFHEAPLLAREEYRHLQQVAEEAGVIFFSTPEDEGSADLLDTLGVPLFKISSMNITHLPLLKHVARKGKPVILSTGASTVGEIDTAVQTLKDAGCPEIVLLHCICNYPTADENVNLRMISHLREVFPDIPIGYSDHTLPENGEGILTAAVALGARVLEKHFTFDHTRLGYDHKISCDYTGIRRIVAQIRRVERALGDRVKGPVPSEAKARVHARRSLVVNRGVPKGTLLSKGILDVKRPGTGIGPALLECVVGMRLKRDIEADTVLTWEHLK